jgi:hypothetical protein
MKSLEETSFCVTSSLWRRVEVGLLCFILCSCVTDFEPNGINELADILVVEGIITDDETIITLSRSENLLSENFLNTDYVNDARVYVVCDNGTQFQADDWWGIESRGGKYTIKTGKLDLKRKYRLMIEIEEYDIDCASTYSGSRAGS